MAVEIIHNGNKDPLDMLYFLQEDKLREITPLSYAFPLDTQCKVHFLYETYTPTKIHILPVLHKMPKRMAECEAVIECAYQEKKKLFLCIGLKHDETASLEYPLQGGDLEMLVSQCQTNHLYQTKEGHFVCVCSKSVPFRGEKPAIKMAAKDAYKEVIDNDSYDVLSLVSSANDHQRRKIESKTSNVQLKKMLFEEYYSQHGDGNKTVGQEGFSGHGNLTGDGTYMECKLLQEDANNATEVYEDVAVVPLKTNVYERGMVTFSHFLHFFLVTVGAGVGFPFLLVSLFIKSNFYNDAGVLNNLYYAVGYFSFIAFFMIGLIVMLVGLSDPKYKKPELNDEDLKKGTPPNNGAVMATVGFYLILVHCSFALGMFAFKKLGSLMNLPKFNDIFDQSKLTNASFFNILDGIK